MQKKSIQLTGHRTSISLEPEFWQALQQIAQQKNTSVRKLIIQIDNTRTSNLSSSLRVYILNEFRQRYENDVG
ncbi:MAG: ribbon-helix-helix domain-containing protein [Alphaproteobacteria bacterium]|nr:aryl-sulfate sulfotransferase [Alphaproteobacteria bacterium]MBQ3116831.1 ribbon-helix-helix domain-containing protein [Alphaproteobacteria bacterium]MBQ6854331.1 ribbon-helix-helix domain-containing protein [Alphaproteobacteria bacterium]MBQ8557517.1 ribbon-helix-helix domain-containing protein [Alphaproteobacteria bacterium]